MKVALIGDVHANLPALEAVLADAARRRVQAIWNTGDFVGYGAFPEEVVRRLRDAGAVSVIGNYDQKVLDFPQKKDGWQRKKTPAKFRAFQWAYEQLCPDSREYLGSLPQQVRLAVAGRRILLTHGSPDSPTEHISPATPATRLAELARRAEADVVICGHSHLPFDRLVGGVLFINTGSVGRPEGRDPRACYALLRLGPRKLTVQHHRIEYDVQRAASAIRASGLPEAFAEMALRGDDLDGVAAREAAGKTESQPAAGRKEVLTAALKLAERCQYDKQHTQQVTKLALRLFDELQALHGLGGTERFWLNCGALLHDIGWIEGQQRHHKTALRLILADRSVPLDERVRPIVASLARYHRKALPSRQHGHFAALGAADRKCVQMLAAILRLADGLDRTHMDLVRDVRCDVAAKRVLVRCFVKGPAEAEIQSAEKKADLFGAVFRRAVRFETVAGRAAGRIRKGLVESAEWNSQGRR